MSEKRTSSDSGETNTTILVVDDENRVVEAYQMWLPEEIEVRTAVGGEEGLKKLDAEVDVVLLDRRMPGMSGDDVLTAIRDGPHDPRVAMVTAVDPDFDIVEMPFDHYITKPVDPEAIRSAVDSLLTVETYDRRLGDLFTVTQKIAMLEEEKHRDRLSAHAEYNDLVRRREQLEAEIDELLRSIDSEEMEAVFESIPSHE